MPNAQLRKATVVSVSAESSEREADSPPSKLVAYEAANDRSCGCSEREKDVDVA